MNVRNMKRGITVEVFDENNFVNKDYEQIFKK